MMEKIWRAFRHNQGVVIGSVLSLAAVVWAYGCQTTAVSISNPPSRVTREQLHAEVDAYLAQAKLRFEDMDRQDNLKSTVFNTVLNYIETGTLNPVAVALTLWGIVGAGAVVDNRRKDGIIKTYKKESES